MELRLQPKPEIEIEPANKGIVSREKFFVRKTFEKINQNFFAGHLARTWKPKADLVYSAVSNEEQIGYECYFNRTVQNCFVEDYAEEIYLRNPPPCFVVLGKSGQEVENLSREIAEEYGSLLISVEDVVDRVIKTGSESGKFVDRLLRLGVSLTLNFILALISYLAHTPEARHRGYVLCGLPCPPLDRDLPVDQQLNYPFCWDNKPTFFVHVLFQDEDLARARSSRRYEIGKASGSETFASIPRFVDPGTQVPEEERKDRDDDDEDNDNGEGREDAGTSPEPDIDVPPSRPRVQLPRDREPIVWSELESYDKHVKPALDLLTCRFDPQYLIEVDSRVRNAFETVRSRLGLLQIWKVPVPFPFVEPRRNNEKDDESPDGNEIEPIFLEKPETAFLTLFANKVPSPKFRWELSHYNYTCPVSLRAGEVVEGQSRFAVGFMKYIYFLRDEESMRLFMKNPRPFVLPVKPRPPSKFIVIGYPYCGKTSLARSLAREFDIPLLDLDSILKNDLEEKKNVFLDYCREKAEKREMIRLSAQAWRDWRMEEEQRVSLIDEWIGFVRSLLNQRIEQFYSAPKGEEVGSEGNVEASRLGEYSEGEIDGEGGESGIGEAKSGKNKEKELEIRGTSMNVSMNIQSADLTMYESNSTPSAKLIQALRHEDFDFDKKGFEIEANMFFSALWNNFSAPDADADSWERKKDEKFGEDDRDLTESNKSLAGEESVASVTSINWSHLLPPQSLSSLLLRKKPYATREKRKSFRILLAAASKVYWEPSPLKTEFAKWRLPCFMDIPLCEVFADNPMLLYRYCPWWIKQRPLTPDPIDPKHPAVVEAGRKARERAAAVNIRHEREEVGILLRNAIEKAEKDRMRVTGDITSSPGWVVDNMVPDVRVWCILANANLFPTHVFVLSDTEPEFRRIINAWYDSNRSSSAAGPADARTDSGSSDADGTEESIEFHLNDSVEKMRKLHFETDSVFNLSELLRGACDALAAGDSELDGIYEILTTDSDVFDSHFFQSNAVDLFSCSILRGRHQVSFDNIDDALIDESTINTVSFSNNFGRILLSGRQNVYSLQDFPLGAQLEVFTDKIQSMLRRTRMPDESTDESSSHGRGIDFFCRLLTLSQKLEAVKEWLSATRSQVKIVEIDACGKTASQIFSDIVNEIRRPFGKKPRELEPFEREEIDKWTELDESKDAENGRPEGGEEEDVRIFGESGPFCIVNLERNILLPGNPEHALRYYGKLYYFWNRDSKEKFLENPEKYAPYYSPIRCMPPLRVFLVGPYGSEKASLAKAISNRLGIHFIDYVPFLSNKLVPHAETIPGTQLRALNAPLLLSTNHNKEAMEALAEFHNSTNKQRQFWMENPPFYPDSTHIDETLRDLLNLQPMGIHVKDVKLDYETIESNGSESDLQERNKSASGSGSATSDSRYEYASMSEIMKMIENYIRGDSDLTDFCVKKTLHQLWNAHPYVTNGFVLKDFPMRPFDGEVMLKNNWIPDLVIHVDLPEEEAIERNVEREMRSWDERLRQEMNEEQLVEDAVKSIQETRMAIRRVELITQKQKNVYKSDSSPANLIRSSESRFSFRFDKIPKGDRKSSLKVGNAQQRAEDSDDGIAAENIESTIQKEFPRYVFESKFEDREVGRARIVADMIQNYRKDVEEIANIKQRLRDFRVPWMEISSASENATEIFIALDRLKKRIGQRGEFAFSLSPEMAEKLLLQGYYFLSKFGRLCPVQAYRGKNPVNMYRPLASRNKIFPVAYRSYIYFIGGENERSKFIQDPIKYVFREPHRPNVPLRLSVIGPPKSGKSTLCKRLGAMFGLKVVTMGTAIRFVLDEMRDSNLKRSIEGYLKRGCFLPLSLKVEAVVACLNDPKCATQGFVFDGFPYDPATAQSLAEKKKFPFVIIGLVGDSKFGKRNRSRLDPTRFRLGYRQRVNLDARYREWNETYRRFVHWNESTYRNVRRINAETNAVNVFYTAYEILREPYFGILDYVEHVVEDRCLSLEHMCVNHHEYSAKRSDLEDHCPVCWSDEGRLKRSPERKTHRGLVQYRNHFYWICPKHADTFARDPKKHLPPHVPPWPTPLPRAVDRDSVDAMCSKYPVHGYGRCPVTRIDFPERLDWEGSADHAVLYAGEVFLCKNAEMRQRFLARPWRYSTANIAFEGELRVKSAAVESLGPPKVTSLPPIGFLEQTVADLIHQCLQVLGSVRPVYPKLNPACTASVFVALYLKVHNRRRKPHSLEKEYLDFMFYYCKAYRFRVPFLLERELDIEEGQGDFERESRESVSKPQTPDNQSSLCTVGEKVYDDVSPHLMVDLDSQADKKLWSAKHKAIDSEEMILNADDELQEIADIPKEQIVLRYRNGRSSPLPPVANCLTFIYSARPNLKIPEKFNVDSLYQPPPAFETPYRSTVTCNPERQFAISLLDPKGRDRSMSTTSRFNLLREQTLNRRESQNELKTARSEGSMDEEELLQNRFVPRFQFLDVVHPFRTPVVTAVETDPLVFEPQRDYTCAMLLSHFFRNACVLRCYEWEESRQHFEFSQLLDRGLKLCPVRSQFLFYPKVSPSVATAASIRSYQQNFDASNLFFRRDFEPDNKECSAAVNSSTVDFVQTIILNKLDEIFEQLSQPELSYDSFETVVASTSSEFDFKRVICIREVFPYPPLIWDITSRPYYSYCSLPSLFSVPELENIAHERHVSVLDGIVETNENFRYVRYPTWVQPKHASTIDAGPPETSDGNRKCRKLSAKTHRDPIYFVYDFFGLNWTSFLPQPVSIAHEIDLLTSFQSTGDFPT